MEVKLPLPWALPSWRGTVLCLMLVWLGLILGFLPDWSAMAQQWWSSSTYNHVVLIPVIIVWLVAMRVKQLVQFSPQAWWPGLALFAATVMLWALGAFAGLKQITELAAVAMLAASAIALIGPKPAVGLTFPIAYMAFLVPFGDELIAPLQTITAWLTIGLVHISSFKATITGVFIDTPAGLFQVAEACSGIKFLIAMLAFGVLMAHICFRSWQRRAMVMVMAVVVPVLANGIRAWGTIAVAQVKGAAWAAGFDHIIYGWFFFAAVIAVSIACAWPWFDRSPDDPMVDTGALEGSAVLSRLEQMRIGLLPLLLAMAALVLSALLWVRAGDGLTAHLPHHIDMPAVQGWHRVDYTPKVWWEPRATGADHRLLGRYADQSGHTVDVFIALYAAQREGKKANGFGEGALRPDSGWAWERPGPVQGEAKSEWLRTHGPLERLVQTTYRTSDTLTGSALRLRLAVMADHMLLRPRATAMLILSAEDIPGHPAPAAINAFRLSTGPLGPWMDGIASNR